MQLPGKDRNDRFHTITSRVLVSVFSRRLPDVRRRNWSRIGYVLDRHGRPQPRHALIHDTDFAAHLPPGRRPRRCLRPQHGTPWMYLVDRDRTGSGGSMDCHQGVQVTVERFAAANRKLYLTSYI